MATKSALLSKEEARGLIRQDMNVLIGDDDPILSWVVLHQRSLKDYERTIDQRQQSFSHKLQEGLVEFHAQLEARLEKLNEGLIKTSLENVLTEVENKARQDQKLASLLEERLGKQRLFSLVFLGSIVFLTALNVLSAVIVYFF